MGSADASSAEPECAHCGLPVPPALRTPGEGLQFCCAGCRAVWEAIHGCGLERYYQLRKENTVEREGGRVAGPTARGYAEYDHEEFHALHVRPVGGGPLRTEFYLEGVHCAACVWLIEKLPAILDGVLVSRLDFGRAVVEVVWDPQRVALSRIARALDRLGYPPHPLREGGAAAERRAEDRRALIRMAVAGALAGNAMLIAFALYGGILHGMEESFQALFRWTSLALALLAVFWPGRVFLAGGLAALRTGTSHMDLPIALGLLAGLGGGAWNTYTGGGEVYFESVTILVFLLLVGRFVQRRQQRVAWDALELLDSLAPSEARVVEPDGGLRVLPVASLAPGQLVELYAGESVPVDGRIEEGESRFDLSLLSGESRPVHLGPGDRVHAASVNLSSRVRVRVEATGAATRVGRLLELVERCSREKAPVVRFADRLSGWFVFAVMGCALFTLWLGWGNDPRRALENAVALLIVACPCALGLATPLALAAAIGKAARQGILIKGGETLERLSHPGMAWLDKTGTLTRGQVELLHWEGPEELRGPVLALESASAHPFARPFREAFAGLDSVPVEEVEEFPGRGVAGRWRGRSIRIGSPVWLRNEGVRIPPELEAAALSWAERGASPVLIAVDGRARAWAALGDALLPDAAAAVARLRELGWRVGILSGDHQAVVSAVGEQLGIEPEWCRGEVSPEGKLSTLGVWPSSVEVPGEPVRNQNRSQTSAPVPRVSSRLVGERASGRPGVEASWLEAKEKGESSHGGRREDLHRTGPDSGGILMVGDGVNDAAALAAAPIGVAVHGGAEASLAAADVFLTRSGVTPLVELVEGANRTMRVIRRNLVISLLYNLAGVGLAMAGVLNPILAAILMPLSSLTVVSLSFRARTFSPS